MRPGSARAIPTVPCTIDAEAGRSARASRLELRAGAQRRVGKLQAELGAGAEAATWAQLVLGVKNSGDGEGWLVGLVGWSPGVAEGELDGEAGAGRCGVGERGQEREPEWERERRQFRADHAHCCWIRID